MATETYARYKPRMTEADQGMRASMLALLIWDGARTADANLRPWDEIYSWQREALREVAAMLWPWLCRNLIARTYADPVRLAHRIHATYTAFSIERQGMPRRKCRSWEGDMASQRTAMLAAAQHIIAVLRDD